MMNKTTTTDEKKSIFRRMIKFILSVFVFLLEIMPDNEYMKRKAKEKKDIEYEAIMSKRKPYDY